MATKQTVITHHVKENPAWICDSDVGAGDLENPDGVDSKLPVVYVVIGDDDQYVYSAGSLETARFFLSLNDIPNLRTNDQERICEYVPSSQLRALQEKLDAIQSKLDED
jgi:hypothetical protein